MPNTKKTRTYSQPFPLRAETSLNLVAAENYSRSKRISVTVYAIVFAIDRMLEIYEAMEQKIISHRTKLERPIRGGSGTFEVGTETSIKLAMFAWQFVDWSHRLHKLLGTNVEFSRTKWHSKFLDVLKQSEDLRHELQHFDRYLNKNLHKNFPVMGTVSAFIEAEDKTEERGYGDLHMLIFPSDWGYALDSKKSLGMTSAPLSEPIPVDSIGFCIGDYFLNISFVVESLKIIRPKMTTQIQEKYGTEI